MEQKYVKPTFEIFINSLSLQTMIALGLIESPITKKFEKNLRQAKFLIDTLDMIKEKTEGNLSQEEKELLENILSNLKLNYVKVLKEDENR